MYFSKSDKMVRIRYISDQNGQDMDGDWQKFNQLWKLSVCCSSHYLLAYVSMCGTLACATEKNFLAISEFQKNALIHHSGMKVCHICFCI